MDSTTSSESNPGATPKVSAKDETVPDAASSPPWAEWSDEQLLDLRFKDLGVAIRGTQLEDYLKQIRAGLKRRNLLFRPHFWLAEDWFTPDGVPGIGIPFYLAHPRLARLEKNQVMEVEGGTPDWCMRILRHEVGHAIDNAYCLRRKRRRQLIFGKSSLPYPEYYSPKPYSKRFVLHLDSWYAQSHPDEDFAETFAVWFQADSSWRKRYVGWPAMKKLEYMDELMQSIAGVPPRLTTRTRIDPIYSNGRTLREYYDEKRDRYGLDYPNFYDRDLTRLFTPAPDSRKHIPASRFIRRIRKEVRRKVAAWTGSYQYTIDQVLTDMIERCQELDLRLVGPEEPTKIEFTILLTVQTMNYLHSGHHRIAM